MSLTLKPGILSVASAYPDPPFELADGSENGFDIDLMRAICAHLGLQLQPRRYPADNFDGIFDGLTNRSYDAVISGTTITPARAAMAQFSEPFLEFNQGVAVNRERTPNISGESDLHGLTAGIQVGNTSDSVARRWVTQGLIAGIPYYPYDGIQTALNDWKQERSDWSSSCFPSSRG
jgi:ABC-type amino acid transport substrate-binding protein